MIYSTSGNRTAINLDYLQHIRNKIINPLLKNGNGGIEEALEAMNYYHLLREDLDNIVEVSHWSGQKDIMARIDSKVRVLFHTNESLLRVICFISGKSGIYTSLQQKQCTTSICSSFW